MPVRCATFLYVILVRSSCFGKIITSTYLIPALELIQVNFKIIFVMILMLLKQTTSHQEDCYQEQITKPSLSVFKQIHDLNLNLSFVVLIQKRELLTQRNVSLQVGSK